MLVLESKLDQNINRVYAKMSEGCSGRNINTKVSNVENLSFINNLSAADKNVELNSDYDHVYASNSGDALPNPSNSSCQNAESEVKFLKEWLLLHLDLIQQQNDEILNKEKTILMLKQENEMLREHINCIQKGISSQSQKIQESNLNNFVSTPNFEEAEVSQSASENKEQISIIPLSTETNSETVVDSEFNEGQKPSEDISANENTCDMYYSVPDSSSKQEETKTEEIDLNHVTRSDIYENNQFNNNNNNNNNISNSTGPNSTTFTVHNSVDDSLKNLRMSIRRKRLCSNSSILSNNDSLEERNLTRKLRKKRKWSLKNDKLLTCNEQYLTQTGEVNIAITEPESCTEFTRVTNLEVPRWRVKVYTSCYTMEGTENLDDDVFNKRHLRHENDERRRKRWDVQRIREQRIIEKLKQRQERVASSSKGEDQSEPIQSLWPQPEDIKYLEVCDQLPVSALGAPLPRFIPSEFSLPWLSNPHFAFRKNSSRRSTVRKKATKR